MLANRVGILSLHIYDKVLSRKEFHEFCKIHGFIIREEYGHGFCFNHIGLVTLLERWFVRIINVISFGKLASDYNNLTYILERK